MQYLQSANKVKDNKTRVCLYLMSSVLIKMAETDIHKRKTVGRHIGKTCKYGGLNA